VRLDGEGDNKLMRQTAQPKPVASCGKPSVNLSVPSRVSTLFDVVIAAGMSVLFVLRERRRSGWFWAWHDLLRMRREREQKEEHYVESECGKNCLLHGSAPSPLPLQNFSVST